MSAFMSPVDGGDAQHPDGASHSDVKHVLGVAFPQFSLDGSCDAELERRFLQLAYAVCHLSCSGAAVSGYFAVLRRETRDAIQQLRVRYGVGDAVQIVFASLLIADVTRLAEVSDDAIKAGDPSVVDSVAREIAIDALRREIDIREPGVVDHTSHWSTPFGVQWDYYGRRQLSVGQPEADDESCPRLF